jgi:flagellar biosynthesis chaperone FliJ
MNHSNILQLLVEQSTQVHYSNLGRLGEAQRQLDQSRKTQRMISEYRQLQQIEKSMQKGKLLSNHHLMTRSRFVEKLDLALTQQDSQIVQDEHNIANNQNLVSASATRLRSIERLLRIRLARQTQKQQQTEQRQIDEQAALTVARRQRA